MVVGRLVGWLLIGLSVLMASADAVMALGPGDHTGIATRDVWMLLAGRNWDADGQSLATLLMAWPAWTILAPVGLLIVVLARPRRRARGGRSRYEY